MQWWPPTWRNIKWRPPTCTGRSTGAPTWRKIKWWPFVYRERSSSGQLPVEEGQVVWWDPDARSAEMDRLEPVVHIHTVLNRFYYEEACQYGEYCMHTVQCTLEGVPVRRERGLVQNWLTSWSIWRTRLERVQKMPASVAPKLSTTTVGPDWA
jgi:hypothetical protein